MTAIWEDFILYTLLVLEDDAELNQTISNALRNEGYRVLTAFPARKEWLW